MGQTVNQGFPPEPKYTEKQLPDLKGRVFLVTGGASGVGFQLAAILYAQGAKVYLAARSESKAQIAIEEITKQEPHGKGQLLPLAVDLSDLPSVRSAAEKFLQQETRLDVLVNNAGVMRPPAGSRSKQGYDLEMGTNVLGPFLLTRLLRPLMQRTAASQAAGSVRCVWVSSMIAMSTPKGGVIFDEQSGAPKILKDPMENYMQSKVGSVFIAKEASRRDHDGIIHVSVHPGIIRTNLQRHQSPVVGWVLEKFFKPAKYGAYSELFGAVSPEVTLEDHNGDFIIPWGRFGPIPKHIQHSLRAKGDASGTGVSARFWDWIESETRKYIEA